jgi:HSP20 family protein
MSEKNQVATGEEAITAKKRALPTAAPLVDIYENEEEIVLYADMPGVDKEHISIHIDNGKLTLGGLREMERKGVVNLEEFGDLEFQRTFSVPQTIDVGKVTAELKEGVLQLHLPKSAAAKPRQIKISAG